jgi:hypothetical protein
MIRQSAILGSLLVLAACGGGGGGGGGLSQDLASTQAAFQVIDLDTGAVRAAGEVAGLASDPALRDRYLVVRRLPTRTAVTGQAPGTFAVQPDETLASSAQAPCYIAVFELTRGQWKRLAGDEPWTLVGGGLAGTGGDDLPACGISHARALAVLAAARARGLELRLPSDVVWESAARSGGAIFPWGESRDATVVAAAAVVAETASALGPQPVGQRAAAPSGCYDLVGNLAEWTAEGHLRGGSWNDPLSLARPANIVEAESDLPYAQAGLRVTFQPASR